jgi:hypothetical protein
MWLPIPGFNNYEASIEGQIKNRKTKRILKQQKTRGGYYRVILNQKSYLVHRVVALTFLDKGSYKIVEHINNKPSDNTLKNLKWSTQKENIKNAYRDGLCSDRKGINNPNHKKNKLKKWG